MKSKYLRSFLSITLILVVSLGPSRPLNGHQPTVHRGLTYTAVEIMNDAQRAGKPEGVSDVEWTQFLSDLTTGLGRLKVINSPCPRPVKESKSLGDNLGDWAADVDNQLDDTHLGVNPLNTGATGFISSALSSAERNGLTMILVPIVCAGSCVASFFGLGGDEACRDCVRTAEKLAADVPQASDVTGMFPLAFDITNDSLIGFWHFVNMRETVSNTYDDHQGLHYEEAGPEGVPGAFDVVIMAGADLLGLTINYDKSQGVHKYQNPNPGDAFPDNDEYEGTNTRGQFRWQAHPFGHTPMEPLDNLGAFGWKRFKNATKDDPAGWSFENLGYVMHALGDATVPQHVVGSSAHGHRPFEDAQEQLWISDDIPKQLLLVTIRRQILLRAIEYRREILSWRASGHPNDVPVRHLVRSVARKTLALSRSSQTSNWPFNDLASTLYVVSEQPAVDMYREIPDAAQLVMPYMIEGIAAKIAFLMSAAERIDKPAPSSDPRLTLTNLRNSSEHHESSLAKELKQVDKVPGNPLDRSSTRVPAVVEPEPTTAMRVFTEHLNRDYSRIARLLIEQKITPAEYLQRVRDRTRKAERAWKDPAWAESWLCGDCDADFVPNDRDCDLCTGYLQPTDDNGRSTNEPLPKGPSAKDVQDILSHIKLSFAPKCPNAPEPHGVKIQNCLFDLPSFMIVVDQEKNQAPGCEVLYHFSIRVARTKNKAKVSTSYAELVFKDSSSQPGAPPGQRHFVISKLDAKIPEATRRTIFDLHTQDPPGVERLFEIRVRTIAPNGHSSPWGYWDR